MSKHTPGPWLYRAKDEGVYTAPPPNTAYAYGDYIFGFGDQCGPSDDDLKLVLAAPELLEVIKSVEQEYEHLRWMKNCELRRGKGAYGIAVDSDEAAIEWQSHNKNLERLTNIRRAAIAKATT